jgi:hypothetical protein
LEEAMSLHRCMTTAVMAPLILVAVLTAHASPAAPGVTVALLPTQQVTLGGTFDLYIQVTEAGSEFNGFDAVIGYDPAALTELPLSQAEHETAYMLGGCGNSFYIFKSGASTDTITDVRLGSTCPTLTGPGQIFHLRFQASMTQQVTRVSFLTGLQFYNAGLYVHPVNSTDVLIGIGMPVGVEPPAPPKRLSLRATPNPSPGSLTFTVESGLTGPETLIVMDVQGRTVRRFAGSRAAPGTHTIAWDGRNEAGAKLPPGMYLARLEVAGRAVWTRVTLLH